MKGKKNLLDQLRSLSYFSKDSLYQLSRQLGLSSATADTYISRFLKYKEIIRLKNGLYTSADFFNKNKNNIAYRFYLANIIRMPSYVSSWSALQFYNLTTEVIYNIISVTPKVTRSYATKAGNFNYYSVKKSLFADFDLRRCKSANEGLAGFDYFIASPAKALFDLLYFKTCQFRGIRMKDVGMLIEELRIDIAEMSKKEQHKFHRMIKGYINNE